MAVFFGLDADFGAVRQALAGLLEAELRGDMRVIAHSRRSDPHLAERTVPAHDENRPESGTFVVGKLNNFAAKISRCAAKCRQCEQQGQSCSAESHCLFQMPPTAAGMIELVVILQSQ